MDDELHEAELELSETWAGHILLEQLRLAEMRQIIRDYSAMTDTPHSAIAAELKMSPRRLRSFLAGADLTNDDWTASRSGAKGSQSRRSCRRRSRSACSRAGRPASTCATCARRSRTSPAPSTRVSAGSCRRGRRRRRIDEHRKNL